MNETRDKRHLAALGSRIFSEANDLKRTPEALAEEIEFDIDTIHAAIDGRSPVETAEAIIRAMADKYPVSLADLWVEPDDTESGVKIMRDEESRATLRFFDRKDRDGDLTPYYEYRDTAMSRTAPFKPEWIQPIRLVDDADPDNPDVAYNHGHLMHQCTFFIGEVNFYWRIAGQGYCTEMNTGDSNYISPFVPHSFAGRNPDRPGLILAVTYGGDVRRALGQFGLIGPNSADELAGNPTNSIGAFRARLDRYLAAESLNRQDLADRLLAGGMDRTRIDMLTGGNEVPTADETVALAKALHIRAEDLMVTPLEDEGPVTVRYAGDTPERLYPKVNNPAYRMRELARTRRQPGLKGFDLSVLSGVDTTEGQFRHSLHQYVYNYGGVPVSVLWNEGENENADIINPGDSAYIRPMVSHSFSVAPDQDEGRLVIVRIPGTLSDAVIDEFSTFAVEGRSRVAGETKQWF
ncbi:MAG: hypothetical protein HQ512_09665 [Rhodospirillales bacterium]|nr:hypothetical protein [Rhodospirillales bacterium]